MWENAIVYEQPLNELMRVGLRLEHLFKQVKQTLEGEKKWHSKLAIRIFSDCLAVVDRPDLKPRLIKEFNRYQETLRRWQVSPNIDRVRLQQWLSQTEKALSTLQNSSSRLVDPLLDDEFFVSLRQNISIPAGDCSFSMPRLHYWLHNSPEKRIEDLRHWWSGFTLLRNLVDFMMQIVRSACHFQKYEARDGMFQATLDPNLPCQLCLVMIPEQLEIYPEISVGRHGINIRFIHPETGLRPMQTTDNTPFQLSVCII